MVDDEPSVYDVIDAEDDHVAEPVIRETAPGPVFSATRWPTNGHMIEDLARLRYLLPEWRTLDPTGGKLTWWAQFRPDDLVVYSDQEPWASNGSTLGPCDFRSMPEHPDGSFPLIAFDPPYAAQGGRKTSTMTEHLVRYGRATAPDTAEGVQEVMHDGLREMARIVAPAWRQDGRYVGGYILAKCCAYTWCNELWEGDTLLRNFAVDELGLTVADRFDFISNGSVQDPNRTKKCPKCKARSALMWGCEHCDGAGRVKSVQISSRRNTSVLYVFQKVTKKRRSAPGNQETLL